MSAFTEPLAQVKTYVKGLAPIVHPEEIEGVLAALAQVERLATDMERQRDGWQRHAGSSDQEVANLRLAVRTIMEALDIEAVAPELLAVDGANLVLRRIGTIVDEGERGFRERDDAEARAAEMERSLVKHHAAGAMDGVLPGDRCPVCAALSAREEGADTR